MNKISSICIITDEYPTPESPRYTFVEQLIVKWVSLGIHCTVINPNSFTAALFRNNPLKPKRWHQHGVRVICPRYISYSTTDITAKLTLSSFIKACDFWLKKHHEEFDVIYGHFIYPSGIAASVLGEKYDLNAFLAYGENTTYTIDYLGVEKTRTLLKNLKGVVSVSTQNKNVLIDNQLVDDDKVEVIPNSVDLEQFYPRNKEEMRRKYHVNTDDFVVIFVGNYREVKGSKRLLKALELLDNKDIKSIFIGKGQDKPVADHIVFEGTVTHGNIPEYLSMGDVFVLPTIAEGCCNAIVEALACGLPVVSSDDAFNDDILDDTCSIRVDSYDIYAIAKSIEKLYKNEELKQRLSNGALEKAKTLDLETRAKRILRFMNDSSL